MLKEKCCSKGIKKTLEYLLDLTYLTYIRTWVMVRPLQNARWRPLSVQQRRLAMPNLCLNLLFPLSHLNTCPIWYTPDDPVAFWDPRVACVSNNPTILWSACTLFFPCCHFNQQVMSVKLSFKEHQKAMIYSQSRDSSLILSENRCGKEQETLNETESTELMWVFRFCKLGLYLK